LEFSTPIETVLTIKKIAGDKEKEGECIDNVERIRDDIVTGSIEFGMV